MQNNGSKRTDDDKDAQYIMDCIRLALGKHPLYFPDADGPFKEYFGKVDLAKKTTSNKKEYLKEYRRKKKLLLQQNLV